MLRAHHAQREEAVALQHLAEVELAAHAERARPGVERRLPAGRAQLVYSGSMACENPSLNRRRSGKVSRTCTTEFAEKPSLQPLS
jgi:hypothetical protein